MVLEKEGLGYPQIAPEVVSAKIKAIIDYLAQGIRTGKFWYENQEKHSKAVKIVLFHCKYEQVFNWKFMKNEGKTTFKNVSLKKPQNVLSVT